MEHKRPTQRQRVLDYIRDFGSITSYEANKDLGVTRLASRIAELKKMGLYHRQQVRACREQVWRGVPCEAV